MASSETNPLKIMMIAPTSFLGDYGGHIRIYEETLALQALGHEVITADNGRDGVSMAVSEQPDVVLMDIVMPDMNGFQATRQIARGADTKHTPVIIVSSKNQETDKVWGERH